MTQLPVLGGVNVEDPGLDLPVEAEHLAALDPGEVDGQVEGADDAVVAVGEGVLDVVAGGVDQHAAVVPGAGLYPGVLVHRAQHLQLPAVCDNFIRIHSTFKRTTKYHFTWWRW